MHRNSLGQQTGRGTPKRQDHFRKRCSSLAIRLVWRQGAVVITFRPALEAETGADLTSLARDEPGPACPTTWFGLQSVHSHTKRYQGASGLSRSHHWLGLTTVDRSWRSLRKIDNRQALLSEATAGRENVVCMALIEICQKLRSHYVLPPTQLQAMLYQGRNGEHNKLASPD